uniref:Uncharacterized protein n=1 Tax=Chromera velia CCMP2878 TaxID=1169474 RepID=A0A0G4F5Z6_9ALVE|eukprot:Cvel_15408.t1-p1 / transcript=Cvel_15408.t1 / gene=Cvel_15408 / organism=Chromera_velia_CCMP2878 / gene_product=hypothetical protein / transcript_product=hypothetical protein / location=Cvel_scaffold1138:17304-27089(+) / protein_length=1139 / sequence_SO=supercontig / SO=protein_coding / is_pseudo=false
MTAGEVRDDATANTIATSATPKPPKIEREFKRTPTGFVKWFFFVCNRRRSSWKFAQFYRVCALENLLMALVSLYVWWLVVHAEFKDSEWPFWDHKLDMELSKERNPCGDGKLWCSKCTAWGETDSVGSSFLLRLPPSPDALVGRHLQDQMEGVPCTPSGQADVSFWCAFPISECLQNKEGAHGEVCEWPVQVLHRNQKNPVKELQSLNIEGDICSGWRGHPVPGNDLLRGWRLLHGDFYDDSSTETDCCEKRSRDRQALMSKRDPFGLGGVNGKVKDQFDLNERKMKRCRSFQGMKEIFQDSLIEDICALDTPPLLQQSPSDFLQLISLSVPPEESEYQQMQEKTMAGEPPPAQQHTYTANEAQQAQQSLEGTQRQMMASQPPANQTISLEPGKKPPTGYVSDQVVSSEDQPIPVDPTDPFPPSAPSSSPATPSEEEEEKTQKTLPPRTESAQQETDPHPAPNPPSPSPSAAPPILQSPPAQQLQEAQADSSSSPSTPADVPQPSPPSPSHSSLIPPAPNSSPAQQQTWQQTPPMQNGMPPSPPEAATGSPPPPPSPQSAPAETLPDSPPPVDFPPSPPPEGNLESPPLPPSLPVTPLPPEESPPPQTTQPESKPNQPNLTPSSLPPRPPPLLLDPQQDEGNAKEPESVLDEQVDLNNSSGTFRSPREDKASQENKVQKVEQNEKSKGKPQSTETETEISAEDTEEANAKRSADATGDPSNGSHKSPSEIQNYTDQPPPPPPSLREAPPKPVSPSPSDSLKSTIRGGRNPVIPKSRGKEKAPKSKSSRSDQQDGDLTSTPDACTDTDCVPSQKEETPVDKKEDEKVEKKEADYEKARNVWHAMTKKLLEQREKSQPTEDTQKSQQKPGGGPATKEEKPTAPEKKKDQAQEEENNKEEGQTKGEVEEEEEEEEDGQIEGAQGGELQPRPRSPSFRTARRDRFSDGKAVRRQFKRKKKEEEVIKNNSLIEKMRVLGMIAVSNAMMRKTSEEVLSTNRKNFRDKLFRQTMRNAEDVKIDRRLLRENFIKARTGRRETDSLSSSEEGHSGEEIRRLSEGFGQCPVDYPGLLDWRSGHKPEDVGASKLWKLLNMYACAALLIWLINRVVGVYFASGVTMDACFHNSSPKSYTSFWVSLSRFIGP